MHVDWDWIKQRPHHIAEHLSDIFDTTVCYPFVSKRKLLVKNKRNKASFVVFCNLPFRKKVSFINTLNKLILRSYFSLLIRRASPDYIWITFPDFSWYIPSWYKGSIIYDCMDDCLEFTSSPFWNNKLIEAEKNAVAISSLVIVSSQNLMQIMRIRYQDCNPVLVRNAFGGKVLDNFNSPVKSKSVNNNSYFNIAYIGTISSWFDFESLLYCLDLFSNIRIHLIGPIDVEVHNYSHPRMFCYGSRDHEDLPMLVDKMDCMIMPFIVNKLILSVDPVKLYEYINYDKPIISVYYPEVEKFTPFADLYKSKIELSEILREYISVGCIKKKYTSKQRKEFLNSNSWGSRMKQILCSMGNQ